MVLLRQWDEKNVFEFAWVCLRMHCNYDTTYHCIRTGFDTVPAKTRKDDKRMNRKMSQKISEKFANFGIIVACLVIFYPIFLMASLSLKTNGDLLTNPFGISFHFQWQNYTEAIKQMNYWQALYNSAIITGFAAVLATFFSALTAYALARAPRC